MTQGADEGGDSRNMTGRDHPPSEDGGVVKAQLPRQPGRTARPTDYLGNFHGAECGTNPQYLSSANVGQPRTRPVGKCHNQAMAQKSTMGERLRGLRKSRGLTQAALSAETGIDRSHLSKIESDKDAPGRGNLQALATFYGVTMDYLQAGAKPGSPQIGDQDAEDGTDAVWIALGREIEAMPKEMQDAIADFIRVISRHGRHQRPQAHRAPRKR